MRAASLGELLASLTPGIPVCIMVHGSFMDSPSVVPESAKTWQWLRHGAGGRPFQMVYFRWPSWKLPTALINIDIAVLGRLRQSKWVLPRFTAATAAPGIARESAWSQSWHSSDFRGGSFAGWGQCRRLLSGKSGNRAHWSADSGGLRCFRH
ncbi:MAG UNVERIFIED_CONTAM: hypothetical protein LVR18_28845 [Planctomycetaceae bacterium]